MGNTENKLERLRRFNAAVLASDAGMAEESLDLAPRGGLESMGGRLESGVDPVGLESIIMRRTRPVLSIRDDAAQLVFVDPIDSEIWTERLQRAAPLLTRAARAVGRIDLTGSDYEWVGTGWLVRENILVTNRHVANAFAVRQGGGLTFRMGADGRVGAAVDFLQEIDNPRTLAFRLIRPLHIEPAPGPDVAFFEIEMTSGDAALASPIPLAAHIAETGNAATIGYPAFDSRIPEPDLMEEIYGRIYNKKRLAPGGVTRVEASRLLHNCTTLGGNSGSALLDLDSGEALGLHFSGAFLATNYAVRADVVRALLDRLETGPRPVRPDAPEEEDADVGETEAVAADYRDRAGYRPDFLGPEVPLPVVLRDAADVLAFPLDGGTETELRYEHYSVVMSRSRRMCFYSAVNIDGGLSKKSKRVGWKWDPRLPREFQIMKECYGNPPRFSRGHMTRREDPGWGNADTAKRGNEDSMHVTNATPQMQAFNSPIWLALEDHALDHAREDAMKISVFTGAYFADEDPTMYGVRIPTAFWKIIAFIHDETGALCATGYEMDQGGTLQPEEEFVFGQFVSPQLGIATQVSIGSIEARSGISFGNLAEVDPLNADDESLAGQAAPVPMLETLGQIRFLA